MPGGGSNLRKKCFIERYVQNALVLVIDVGVYTLLVPHQPVGVEVLGEVAWVCNRSKRDRVFSFSECLEKEGTAKRGYAPSGKVYVACVFW